MLELMGAHQLWAFRCGAGLGAPKNEGSLLWCLSPDPPQEVT